MSLQKFINRKLRTTQTKLPRRSSKPLNISKGSSSKLLFVLLCFCVSCSDFIWLGNCLISFRDKMCSSISLTLILNDSDRWQRVIIFKIVLFSFIFLCFFSFCLLLFGVYLCVIDLIHNLQLLYCLYFRLKSLKSEIRFIKVLLYTMYVCNPVILVSLLTSFR